jgi:hypothetical protein
MPTQPARVQVLLRDVATARKLHKVDASGHPLMCQQRRLCTTAASGNHALCKTLLCLKRF